MNKEVGIKGEMVGRKRDGFFHTSYFIPHTSPQSGFSLVEMLFYTALLALSLLAVTHSLIAVTRSYGALRAAQRIEREAAPSLERMVREIRNANAVDAAGSVLGAHPGRLLLGTTDGAGAPRTVEFLLDGEQLTLKENGALVGALTSGKATVSNLVFRRMVTARSTGVKIELTLASGAGQAARTERFYATAVLRDSY